MGHGGIIIHFDRAHGKGGRADQADADNVSGRASETEQQQRATKDAEPLRRIVFL